MPPPFGSPSLAIVETFGRHSFPPAVPSMPATSLRLVFRLINRLPDAFADVAIAESLRGGDVPWGKANGD